MGSLKTVRMDTHFLSEGAGCLIFSQQKGMSWQILPPVGLPPFVCRAAAPPPPGGFIHRSDRRGSLLGREAGLRLHSPLTESSGLYLLGTGQWEQFLDPLLEGASVPAA